MNLKIDWSKFKSIKNIFKLKKEKDIKKKSETSLENFLGNDNYILLNINYNPEEYFFEEVKTGIRFKWSDGNVERIE